MLTRVFIACMIAASLASAQPGPMMGGASPMGGLGGPMGGAGSPIGGVGGPIGGGPTPFSTLAALVAGSTGSAQTMTQPMNGLFPQVGATGMTVPSMMAPSATAAPSFSASSAAPFTTTAAPTMPVGQLDNQAVPAQSAFPAMSSMPSAQAMPAMSGMPALGVNTQASMTGGAQLPNLQNAFNTAAAPVGSTPLTGFTAPTATGMPSVVPNLSSAPVASTNSILPSATGLPAMNSALPAANSVLPVVSNSALPAASSSPLGALPGTSSATAGALPMSSSLPTLPASTTLPVASNGALSMPSVSQAPAGSTVQSLNGAAPTVVEVPALNRLI